MRPSIISDELLRQFISVGQVDVIIGLPTLNNASTVGDVVRAVYGAFGRQLHRERTVLINIDGGSEDGTPDVVRAASPDDSGTVTALNVLRTTRRVSVPFHGVPGKGMALRVLFAAADLLQARALAVVTPELTNATPDWIHALVRPVLKGEADYVSPVYARHPLEAPLVTQLVRPMLRAVYGVPLRDPMTGEFGCSSPFAAHCLEQPIWDDELLRVGIDLWLVATAMAEGMRIAQPRFGQLVPPLGPRPALPEVFQQVVGALFACLDLHASYWLARPSGSIDCGGETGDPLSAPPAVDAPRLVEAFARDFGSIAPILERLLRADTLAKIRGLADRDASGFRYSDELWVSTVYEFAASHHRGVMHRQHVTQAMVPLYLGRVASFFLEHGSDAAPVVEQRLEALCLQYEQARNSLVEQWTPDGMR